MSNKSEIKSAFTFTWKIENYFSCPSKNGEEIESPAFSVEYLSGSEWILRLFPEGYRESDKGYISCYLCRKSGNAEAARRDAVLKVCCNIEIIDAFGEVLACGPMQNHSFKRGEGDGFHRLVKNTRLMADRKWSFEDSLTVRCNMISMEATKIRECVALTKIGVDRCSFKLCIDNFTSTTFLVKKKFFCSDTFQFQISISTRGDDFKINIFKENRSRSPYCFLICKIALLDLKGIERISRSDRHLYEDLDHNWQFPFFLKISMLKKEASKYLSNNSFTLLCDFSISNGTTEIKYIHYQYPFSVNSSLSVNPVKVVPSAVSVKPSVKVADSELRVKPVKVVDSDLSVDPVKVLQDDLRRLYTSHENSDVKLRAGNKTFLVHKLVLSARSPVFRAMFDQDMLENQTGVVDISDVDAESMNYFLGFIYTGTVDNLSYESSLRLLVAADKYQVFSLKEKCSSSLMSDLSVDNVCEIAIMADMVGHELLKSSAVDYIRAHASQVLPTAKWKQCVKENGELATEILYKLSVDFEKK